MSPFISFSDLHMGWLPDEPDGLTGRKEGRHVLQYTMGKY